MRKQRQIQCRLETIKPSWLLPPGGSIHLEARAGIQLAITPIGYNDNACMRWRGPGGRCSRGAALP